ncbi:MAG: hypothetical protein C0394_07520 [Syntrophus sp. (in: bacteria)]|nr:hypothetical protein [Syntrophus sp. (in: bacteria)]
MSFTVLSSCFVLWSHLYSGQKNEKAAISRKCGFLYEKTADCVGGRGFQFLCLAIIETEQQTPCVR